MKLFKVLSTDGSPRNGGSGKWFLPKGDRPGKWMPEIKGDLEPCRNGYHLCREGDLLQWLGTTIYEVEHKGEIVESDDKVVVRKARLICKMDNWSARTARLFACDCAWRALKFFEKEYPEDKRARNAIKTAKKFANREATTKELMAEHAAALAAVLVGEQVAEAAGWTLAGIAAHEAVRAAKWTAIRGAGWMAAEGAAEAAVLAATTVATDRWTRAEAWEAEEKWQIKRLMKYINGTPG